MKVAIVSANFGGIDNVLPIPDQTFPFDRKVYTEENSPFPLPNLDNRTKARYIKEKMHRFIPEYDVFIWLDGRVQVTSKLFVENFLQKLNGHDMVCTLHSERKDIYSEMEFILWTMNKGNHYLISRYGHQSIRKEFDFYTANKMPKTFPLFSSGMWARWNNEKCNDMCDEWFMRNIEYSNFDQTMLSFVAWKHNMKIATIPYENQFYKVLKHKIYGYSY